MSEVQITNMDSTSTIEDLSREFKPYGEIRGVIMHNRGSGIVTFRYLEDAKLAIHSINGKFNWVVDLSQRSKSFPSSLVKPSGPRRGFSLYKCSICSCSGHFASYCPYAEKKDQPPSPPWFELPEDITEKILRKLGPIGVLCSAQYVCTTWRKICRDPTMWHVIDMWKINDIRLCYAAAHMEMLFLPAVDLSQGQAMEINMDDFGDNYYLEYIAKRCSNLRCLRLAFCGGLSGRALSKAVKAFPLLGELHLQCVVVQNRFIEAIGQSCPKLKKFAMNRARGYKEGVLKRSEDALAIGKFMPELHHLQLFGNTLTNEVLHTILNGCPKLEYLDLRQCYNLNLEGDLGKRCAQQIKILWRPHDPLHNYEWLGEVSWEYYYDRNCYDGYYHPANSDLDTDYDEDGSDYSEDGHLSDTNESSGGSNDSGIDE